VLEHCKVLVVFIVLMLACFNANPQPPNKQYSDRQFKAATLNIEAIKNKVLALEQARKLSHDYSLSAEQKISLSIITASLYHANDNLVGAIETLEHAISLAADNNLISITASAQKTLGIMLYFSGLNTKALAAYKQALALLSVEDEPIKVANIHNNIGLVHASNGDYEFAMDSYNKADSLYQVYGSDVDRTDSYFNIAGLHIHLEHFDMAIKMITSVIRDRTSSQDHEGLAVAYGDLGTAYLKAGNYQQARSFYKKSLKSYKRLEQNYFIASQHHNIAEVENLLGLTKSAIGHANLAITLSEMTDNSYSLIGGFHALALAQYLQGDFDAAYKNILSSLALAKERKISDWANDYLGLKALIQSARGETKTALLSQISSIERVNRERNDRLYRQVAHYQDRKEANDLSRELAKLKQRAALANQQRYLFLFVVLLLLAISFSFYRRHINLKLQINLRDLVAQRTKQLELLAKDLKQANLVKSQFLANVSHEIRTPLTSIIGHAQSLVSSDISSMNDDAKVILRNSVHVHAILNDILDLSSIEVNKLTISYQMHDIHVLVEEIRLLYDSAAQKKGIQLNIDNQLPCPLKVYIDRTRLKQILINLCSNALKFTHHGHITICLSVVDDNLLFKISDSGIGINQDNIDVIFERFTQADSSINRRFGGSGIGLYLSLELAHMMGGDICVDSEIDLGSQFTLSLPYLKKSHCDDEPCVLARTTSDNVTLKGTVLLAEDHDDNRHLITRHLTALGLNVIPARDGEEAINLCSKYQPDLILMDIQMPNIDGIDAFNTLRKRGYTQPIIAFTANAVAHEIDYYLDLGFDDCLTKPIDEARFMTTISHYLAQNVPKNAQELVTGVDVSDLVENFVNSLPDEHAKLLHLMAQSDYEGIARLVHRLSGAASMFGFKVMATLGGEITNKITKNELGNISALLKMLLAMMANTSAEES